MAQNMGPGFANIPVTLLLCLLSAVGMEDVAQFVSRNEYTLCFFPGEGNSHSYASAAT